MDFSQSLLQLNRKGFRLQQKVPYDPSNATINKVTQASKNLFINMLDIPGFNVFWFKEGQDVTGMELQEEYHRIYGRLHKIEYDSLMKRITDGGTPDTLNRDELRKLLIEEARDRNYPVSDQEMLYLDKELNFIPFSPSSNKYESLLNSIVFNRIVKLEFQGKSYVLGSEEGFIEKYLSEEEAAKTITDKIKSGGIVTTKSWTGRLLPAREGKNGERLPAQAIVPWKFRDKEGNIIDMSKYIVEKDGKFVINEKNIASKVLEIFGMRIPNQGPNSQSWIEIVGFLPEASGDLFIATKDYVIQMGSDFDVDKLYTYMYDTYEADDNTILIHRNENTIEEEKRALHNKILDIHIAIHKNPDRRVQEQIANPLGFWNLKDDKLPYGGLANEVEELRRQRMQREEGDNYFTGLSDGYQGIRRSSVRQNYGVRPAPPAS